MNLNLLFSLFLFLVFSISARGQALKDCSSCSTRSVKTSELVGLSSKELRLLKNEIYARKGYVFSNRELKEYFSQYAWYRPLGDNTKVILNDYEQSNVTIIDLFLDEKEIEKLTMDLAYLPEDSKDKYLLEDEVDSIFTDAVRAKLGLYKIWKVYKYADKTGCYLLVLSENHYEKEKYPDCRNKIKAVNYKIGEDRRLIKTFELTDQIKETEGDEMFEDNINFYTRYIYVEDFDGDGRIEPILFYGTQNSEANGFSDGRAYICVYRKGVRSQVFIQNSGLDGGRSISVDKSFYSLPNRIKDAVLLQMERMQENEHCLYPYQWLKSMRNRKGLIDEYYVDP